MLGVLRVTELIDNGGKIYIDNNNTLCWIRSGKSKAIPDLNHLMKRAKDNIAVKNLTVTWKLRDENLAGVMIDNGL